MPESESGALPLGDTPTEFVNGGYDGNRTCDPSIMSAVL
ncbi:putative RNA [Xenorhabdus szentirmaii DSM 16338]|uniref:RNA n=1 Tax=Xenorhabdus szentirmaii DSM 16338 TaxID=1427518 RepID=W1IYD4_9GAMM|nr:putative RNA [Xenorhabdus szentirmaii DSM 16338]